MPSIAANYSAEIEEVVRQLKSERDTWQAVATRYKAAFGAQTATVKELQDICFATQAELENERVQYRHRHNESDAILNDHSGNVDGAQHVHHERQFGTALIQPPSQTSSGGKQNSSIDYTNPLYKKVQQSVAQRNYGAALAEIERLLRSPLSLKARTEGLLLKSSVLQAVGPDELYEALAACCEALELCNRLSDLESFLPRIQYQRGVCYYQLRMFHQAREAFITLENDEALFLEASDYRKSCDEELELLRLTSRRSGFDENRSVTEELLTQLEERPDVSRWQLLRKSFNILMSPRINSAVEVGNSDSELQPKLSACHFLTAGLFQRVLRPDTGICQSAAAYFLVEARYCRMLGNTGSVWSRLLESTQAISGLFLPTWRYFHCS